MSLKYTHDSIVPTNSEKFAPKNSYTKILDSKKIHNTKDINSIAVDEVFSLI